MGKKAATKIINNNIDKTIKYSYNTINTKSNYFIIDGFLYETDLSKILRKEKLSDRLNLKELNNKLFTAPILKQIQAYHKDNFKIASIHDNNNLLTINLNNGSIIAKIQAVYSAIPEQLINCCSTKKELPKTFTMKMQDQADKQIYSIKVKSSLLENFSNSFGYDFYYIEKYYSISDSKIKSKNLYEHISVFILIDNVLYSLGYVNYRKSTIEKIKDHFNSILSIDFINSKLKHYDISINQPEKQEIRFCFTHFAIYYLIANLEQEKQAEFSSMNDLQRNEMLSTIKFLIKTKDYSSAKRFIQYLKNDEISKAKQLFNSAMRCFKDTEKPTQNLLPVLYKAEQKTPIKSTKEPLQIEFKKQVLSLTCKQVYLLPSPAAVSFPAEKPKSKDHFADFEIKYLAKVREKKRYRKANSKFAVIFQQIGQFSSVACLIFLFLNSFVMIQKNQNTFQNLAKVETKTKLKQEIAKEPIKTISNLSDNNVSNTSYHLDSKTAKNGTSDGLKWISLALFGIIKRKEESMKKKKVYFDSETQCNIRLGDQMVFANGKAGKNFVAECKQIYNSPANGKWYYMFEQV